MITALRLPLSFDPLRLQTDLSTVRPEQWQAHFNTRIYEGGWSVVPLRAVAGSPIPCFSDPTARDGYADTEVLRGCPYFREVLASFRCPLLSVRLLRLEAGAVIKEHKDYNLSLEDEDLRLHVVVKTNPEVRFRIGGQDWRWREGECWYGNFNLPHSIVNGGSEARVHLILDCAVDDWLRGLFGEMPGVNA
jgi:quercetin dioxygenase-like cupin family protein